MITTLYTGLDCNQDMIDFNDGRRGLLSEGLSKQTDNISHMRENKTEKELKFLFLLYCYHLLN